MTLCAEQRTAYVFFTRLEFRRMLFRSTGGRIRHHFKHRLWQKNTHVLFVGYQAQGTLGRILVNGVKKLKLFGQELLVRAQINKIGRASCRERVYEEVVYGSVRKHDVMC